MFTKIGKIFLPKMKRRAKSHCFIRKPVCRNFFLIFLVAFLCYLLQKIWSLVGLIVQYLQREF